MTRVRRRVFASTSARLQVLSFLAARSGYMRDITVVGQMSILSATACRRERSAQCPTWSIESGDRSHIVRDALFSRGDRGCCAPAVHGLIFRRALPVGLPSLTDHSGLAPSSERKLIRSLTADPESKSENIIVHPEQHELLHTCFRNRTSPACPGGHRQRARPALTSDLGCTSRPEHLNSCLMKYPITASFSILERRKWSGSQICQIADAALERRERPPSARIDCWWLPTCTFVSTSQADSRPVGERAVMVSGTRPLHAYIL